MTVALAGSAVLWLGAASCGPESFQRGAAEDAAQDVRSDRPGTGGATTDGREDGGGTEGGAGGVDGNADSGSCSPSANGGASGDGSVPTFSSSWTFDGPAGLQGWSPVGQPAEVVAATTFVVDPQDGFPCAGSARLNIPFTGDAQQVAFGLGFGAAQNFAGKFLSARVRLNSANASGTVMVGLAFKSVPGQYVFASSSVPSIVATSGWVNLTLSFDAPDGFVDPSHHDADGGVILPDSTKVLEIDVLVLTGSPPFTTVDISIDTIGVSDTGG